MFRVEGIENAKLAENSLGWGRRQSLVGVTVRQSVRPHGRYPGLCLGEGLVWSDLASQIALSAAGTMLCKKAKLEAVRTNPRTRTKDNVSLTLGKRGQVREVFERNHQALRIWKPFP